MQHALSGRRGTKEEIEKLRQMLDEFERKLP
jgi:hypothetical protein